MGNFVEEYTKYSDKEKRMFSESINKLINEKYITSLKNEDSDIYYFIKVNLDSINDYFKPIDMEVRINNSIKVITLNGEHCSRLPLSRLNSIILLILRLLYNQKIKEVSISDSVIVTTKDIRELYNDIGFSNDEKLNSSRLLEALKLLKKYNIINYKGFDVKIDSFLITIYPTIISLLQAEEIEKIYNRINSYKEGQNEETYED